MMCRGRVRQRLYAIALGYEDLNDHDGLRFKRGTADARCENWPVQR